jgi:TRAP-type uncharacterized transport system fused permease subunit
VEVPAVCGRLLVGDKVTLDGEVARGKAVAEAVGIGVCPVGVELAMGLAADSPSGGPVDAAVVGVAGVWSVTGEGISWQETVSPKSMTVPRTKR